MNAKMIGTQTQRMKAALASRNGAKTPPAPAPAPVPEQQPLAVTPEHIRRDNRMAVKGRLPDGAEFYVRYSASTKTWSGSLAVGELSVEGESRGVFDLLHRLDDKYRAAVLVVKSEGGRLDRLREDELI